MLSPFGLADPSGPPDAVESLGPKDVVVRERLDLVLAFGPAVEWFVVHALGRIGTRDLIPVALADQQQRLGKRRDLAGVIGMIVADADIFDLIGL